LSDKKHFELGEQAQAAQLSKHESHTTKPPMKPKSQRQRKMPKNQMKTERKERSFYTLASKKVTC